MNNIETEISNTSKRISKLLKIGEVIILIVTALAIFAIGILTFASTETKESFLSAFDITVSNGITLETNPQHLFLIFIFMVLYCICMYLILHNTYLIFKDVSEECTPFKHKHVVRIKRIAFMVIIISILGSISDGLFNLFTTKNLTWRINFSGIILGLIIYCLALFFDYGCELQQQSDETL